MADKHVPVLIAGGGSVGLATALFLADRGVPPLVVEAQAGPSTHPRATGLGSRTMEMLRALGLQEAVNAVSVDMVGAGLGKTYAYSLAATDFGAMPVVATARKAWGKDEVSPGRTRGTCPQHRLDSVLLPAARERGATLRYSTRLASLTQDADGVHAVLDSGETVHADYLIGADGLRSTVRTAAGIGVSGPGPLGKPMVSMLFRADLTPYLAGRQFVTCNIENPGVTGMMVTVDGEKEWILHVAAAEEKVFPEARCLELIRAAIGDDTAEVELVSVLPWRPRGFLATAFRSGRIFLVGDAAHAIPPIGAFGLNTGFADAHNLAWKLAAVAHGQAGPALLDTYAAEREPVVRMTFEQALLRSADARLHWDDSPETVAERIAKGVLNAPVVHLGYRYDSTAIIGANPELPSTEDVSLTLDGTPGSRLPHRWIEQAGRTVSTLDLIGPLFTLFTADEHWARAGEQLENLTVRRIPADDAAWIGSLGITAQGAMLVRPDHIVAWRTTESATRPAEELARLLNRLCAQPDPHRD
ncbi:FAD-dependent monooxygenase [Nocardia yamanashiensis]|uniref:FAD-dependent monooxygenase n=1 Tax=Nocardia yamanashiensis TaxID=209247 RepID=UPI001E41936A|nr:FAD-dependent monooxygenase [Nocardia yamanashiensis]UGT43726.1 FAD-dependent monooxygenase [Nocardia yamanashiensis]